MIEFDNKTYILGFWYSNDPQTNNNWLCCIVRDDASDGDWKGWYRFRYKKDEKIFDSDDEKSWVMLNGRKDKNMQKKTEDEITGFMFDMQSAILLMYSQPDYLIIKGGISDLMEKAKTKDWMNIKFIEIGRKCDKS